MNGLLRELRTYFPTGTTEGEVHLLERAFVYDDAFARVCAPPFGSPRLLVGKKGAGKTALIEYLRLKLEAQGVPVVLLRPDDFEMSAMGAAADLATIKRATFAFVAIAVASRFASKGHLATGDGRILAEATAAYRGGELDGVQKLLNILMPIGKAVTSIDFQAMLPRSVFRPAEVAAAMQRELTAAKTAAYLVIDDTDQIGSPRDSNYLPRIWGLLLAVRRLAAEAPNLRCIVSLRTEIWRRLQWDARGAREQADHFVPLVVHWAPSDAHLVRIWTRRLELAAGDRGDPVSLFFEAKDIALPGTNRGLPGNEQRRAWEDFLVKSSRERPRDMIQLMAKVIDSAISTGNDRIGERDLHAVIGQYSRERLDYLSDEFCADCETIREVVRALAEIDNVVSAQRLLTHLAGVPGACTVNIRGRVLKAGSKEDAFLLWRLLHEAGVINALAIDLREKREFRHVNFVDDPNLVSGARWNDMQGYEWEVHPAFRSCLQEIRDAKAAAVGLTYAQLKDRRRRPRKW